MIIKKGLLPPEIFIKPQQRGEVREQRGRRQRDLSANWMAPPLPKSYLGALNCVNVCIKLNVSEKMLQGMANEVSGVFFLAGYRRVSSA